MAVAACPDRPGISRRGTLGFAISGAIGSSLRNGTGAQPDI